MIDESMHGFIMTHPNSIFVFKSHDTADDNSIIIRKFADVIIIIHTFWRSKHGTQLKYHGYPCSSWKYFIAPFQFNIALREFFEWV